MQTISKEQLDTLCENGRAIDSKGGYPAVVIHPDDTITKIWARKKGFFSSSTFSPYSKRFVKHAARLARCGIVVPEILDHAKLEHSHVQIVTYRSLAGESIRELLEKAPAQVNIPSLVSYIHHLHEKGILFGGMHLGNIIQLSNNEGYGLIDFTDVSFQSKPLNINQRARNLSVPMRYPDDIERIQAFGHPDFLGSYLDKLNLTSPDRDRFISLLAQ